MKHLLLTFFLGTSIIAQSQIRNNEVHELNDKMMKSELRNEIRIPIVDGMLPLKCDFHMHTIYSDGSVLPSLRVSEAWQQGLDAIAITDHIEYRPNKDILKGDLNESNRLAKEAAKNTGLIVINGTEITRSKPLGHLNALFVSDANVMDIEDPLVAIDLAVSQGAFILWNHPGWPDDKTTLYPVHKKLIEDNKIHGIEVFNYAEYYPISFDWCNDYNLAYVGNSDVHGLISIDYGMDVKHRPMTLVFAKEKTEAAIKEALFAKRTIAYFDGILAGPEALLKKLFKASLQVNKVGENVIEVYNNSDISYYIKGNGTSYKLPAGKTVRLGLPKSGVYTVENCHVGANGKLTLVAEELF